MTKKLTWIILSVFILKTKVLMYLLALWYATYVFVFEKVEEYGANFFFSATCMGQGIWNCSILIPDKYGKSLGEKPGNTLVLVFG